jgi:putative DNA primase/helicase
MAKEVADEVMNHAKAIAREADENPKNKELKQLATLCLAFAKASNQAWGIANALVLVRSEPGIAVEPSLFDADPWLLNLQNGSLDLRTGKLRAHDRADHITKMAPIEFDPDADCPTWCRFLREVFDDNPALIRFIRRAAGYSLTGITNERCLFFLHGRGRSGRQ